MAQSVFLQQAHGTTLRNDIQKFTVCLLVCCWIYHWFLQFQKNQHCLHFCCCIGLTYCVHVGFNENTALQAVVESSHCDSVYQQLYFVGLFDSHKLVQLCQRSGLNCGAGCGVFYHRREWAESGVNFYQIVLWTEIWKLTGRQDHEGKGTVEIRAKA